MWWVLDLSALLDGLLVKLSLPILPILPVVGHDGESIIFSHSSVTLHTFITKTPLESNFVQDADLILRYCIVRLLSILDLPV